MRFARSNYITNSNRLQDLLLINSFMIQSVAFPAHSMWLLYRMKNYHQAMLFYHINKLIVNEFRCLYFGGILDKSKCYMLKQAESTITQ